jgi:hypothetical protein
MKYNKREIEGNMQHQPSQSFRKEPQLSLPSGNLFRRLLTVRTLATLWRVSTEEVAAAIYPGDRMLEAVLTTKATSAPAMTTTTGWAAELLAKLIADAGDALGAASSAVSVMQKGLLLNWGNYGQISVPAFVASANNAGFVQEGSPIPVRQLASTAAMLNVFKVASISVMSREMMESSNAEALISDALTRSCALAIDAVFFSSNAAVSNTSPAGILNGISTTTASNNTDLFEAFSEDASNLINAVSAVGGNGPFILVTNPGRAVTIATHYISFRDETQFQLVGSSAVGNTMITIAPQAIAAAVDVNPEIETVNAATLVMDTVPGTMDSTGSAHRSVWQTDSIAIKVRWPVSWVVRNSQGVAWLTPTWK